MMHTSQPIATKGRTTVPRSPDSADHTLEWAEGKGASRPSDGQMQHAHAFLSDDWKTYRWALRWFLSAFVLVPGLLALLMGLCYGFDVGPDIAKGVFLGTVMVSGTLWLASAMTISWWRCPNCGRMFFCKWYVSKHFASSCVHCGHAKWRNKPDKII